MRAERAAVAGNQIPLRFTPGRLCHRWALELSTRLSSRSAAPRCSAAIVMVFSPGHECAARVKKPEELVS